MIERSEVSINDKRKSNCERIKNIWVKLMGCICWKRIRANDPKNERDTKRLASSSRRREEAFVEVDENANNATSRLMLNQLGNDDVGQKSNPDSINEGESKRKSSRVVNANSMSRIMSMPNGERGGQIVAGWPPWLTTVAGEAINGWVPRSADSFEKLDKIGQGTYSSVYKARDLETNKIVALKKVRFANMDPESVRFMAREIIILRKLDHPNVMKLEGIITSRVSGSLYLVFDYMEHDLTGLLAMQGVKFTEPQIKCYMQQLLLGLEHCHSRGILHRDIKGSNLLIDCNGNLKIGDFGLATFFSNPQKQPLTSRVVTLWYRPPELLLGATDYGVAVDLWSTGCILAELFSGKPIMPGRTEVEQLHKIFKLCGSPPEEYWKRSKLPHATIFKPQHPYKRCIAETFKDFSSSALNLLDILLAVEPENRGIASSALASEFFTTKPLPCDPSSLPKYPPSKELDVKLREDARRRKAKGEATKKSSKESTDMPASDATAELQISTQKQNRQPKTLCVSENYNQEENGGSVFIIEPSKETARNVYSHSGLSMHPSIGSSLNMHGNEHVRDPGTSASPRKATEFRTQRSFIHRGTAKFSRFTNSIVYRGGSHHDSTCSTSVNTDWTGARNGRYRDSDDSSYELPGQQKLMHKEEQPFGLMTTADHFHRKSNIHYSGPLIPPGGNIEEMLKQHERKIQEAVRKANCGKNKGSKEKTRQTEELLCYGINGR